jgi:hypothetical protein
VRTNLDIYFIATENNRDIFADAFEIAMPVGNILVCDSRCDVEHDDTTLTLDVVSISKPTKLFLACSVPDIETDGSKIG